MLVDTDVMVWYLCGNQPAARFLRSRERFCLSAVTYMELVQGLRNKVELAALRRFLKARGTRVLAISEAVSNRATVYVEEHFLSHSLRLGDALIAATAVEYGMPVVTGNTKHYAAIRELELVPFNPVFRARS